MISSKSRLLQYPSLQSMWAPQSLRLSQRSIFLVSLLQRRSRQRWSRPQSSSQRPVRRGSDEQHKCMYIIYEQRNRQKAPYLQRRPVSSSTHFPLSLQNSYERQSLFLLHDLLPKNSISSSSSNSIPSESSDKNISFTSSVSNSLRSIYREMRVKDKVSSYNMIWCVHSINSVVCSMGFKIHFIPQKPIHEYYTLERKRHWRSKQQLLIVERASWLRWFMLAFAMLVVEESSFDFMSALISLGMSRPHVSYKKSFDCCLVTRATLDAWPCFGRRVHPPLLCILSTKSSQCFRCFPFLWLLSMDACT